MQFLHISILFICGCSLSKCHKLYCFIPLGLSITFYAIIYFVSVTFLHEITCRRFWEPNEKFRSLFTSKLNNFVSGNIQFTVQEYWLITLSTRPSSAGNFFKVKSDDWNSKLQHSTYMVSLAGKGFDAFLTVEQFTRKLSQ